MGDSSSAVSYFEESVKFLSKLPSKDLEVSAVCHYLPYGLVHLSSFCAITGWGY